MFYLNILLLSVFNNARDAKGRAPSKNANNYRKSAYTYIHTDIYIAPLKFIKALNKEIKN